MLQGATKPIYSICLGFSCLEHFNILLPMNAAPVFSSLSGIKKNIDILVPDFGQILINHIECQRKI